MKLLLNSSLRYITQKCIILKYIIYSIYTKYIKLKLISKVNNKPFFFLQARSFLDKSMKGTGIIYDDQFANHLCAWDINYPENPQRYESIIKR